MKSHKYVRETETKRNDGCQFDICAARNGKGVIKQRSRASAYNRKGKHIIEFADSEQQKEERIKVSCMLISIIMWFWLLIKYFLLALIWFSHRDIVRIGSVGAQRKVHCVSPNASPDGKCSTISTRLHRQLTHRVAGEEQVSSLEMISCFAIVRSARANVIFVGIVGRRVCVCVCWLKMLFKLSAMAAPCRTDEMEMVNRMLVKSLSHCHKARALPQRDQEGPVRSNAPLNYSE